MKRAEESVHNELELSRQQGRHRLRSSRRTTSAKTSTRTRPLDPVDRQYPIPAEKVSKLVEHVDELLILEDGYPLVENTVRGLFGLIGTEVKGRMTGELPRTGELNPDLVRDALGLPSRGRAAHSPSNDLGIAAAGVVQRLSSYRQLQGPQRSPQHI